jgi:hypothetical protein
MCRVVSVFSEFTCLSALPKVLSNIGRFSLLGLQHYPYYDSWFGKA